MFIIAGATGNVGSVVAQELLAAGESVRAIVRDPKKGAELKAKGAELAVGTVQDVKFLTGALQGAKGFFTLLPPDYATTDLRAHQRKTADAIAAAVAESRVPHVVLLSSLGADLPSGTGPIVGLHYFENKLRETGTKLTALRASYFAENTNNLVGAAKAQGIYPAFMPRDAAIPTVATKDIGVEAARALRNPPAKHEIVDVLGPTYTANQVAEILGKKLGKTLNIVDIPRQAHAGALQQAGFSAHLSEIFAEMYGAFIDGKVKPVGDRMVQGKTTLDQVVTA